MNGIVKSTAVCRIEVTDMSIFVLCLCLCHSFCVCHRIFVCLCLSSTGISYLYILTPVLMNGMVKSTAVCRIEVTDMSITAMSAFCDLSSAIMPVHLIRLTMKMMNMVMKTISTEVVKMTKLVKDHEENNEYGCHMTELMFLQEKVETPNL